jgi:hypothetical protein
VLLRQKLRLPPRKHEFPRWNLVLLSENVELLRQKHEIPDRIYRLFRQKWEVREQKAVPDLGIDFP